MNNYQTMLHEIESKKSELESKIADAVGVIVAEWQNENQLAVQSIYIDLLQTNAIDESKKYIVTSAAVDLDYKP